MTKKFIVVAGNIGAGKTTLTKKLGKRLDWQTGFESVQDNPYLSDFYHDMAKWSFHLQIFFLGHRAEQHQELAESAKSAIVDRSIYEDAHIFARVLHHMGNLNQRDYDAYISVYEKVVLSLPKPDLLLYVKAPVPTLVDRIRQRGREMESGITADYLSVLDSFYKDWMSHFDLCPVLTIPSNNLNFLHREDHLDLVVDRVEAKLAGKDLVVFPE